MPTSNGRKPHTAYGDVGIMTLTIDGPINAENQGITNENEKQCSMKQNQNLILGRGSEEYILSLREGTLEASTVNWVIPQPWDREWSFQRGGVFSPTQCVIADCKVALISETMQRPVDGSAIVASWGDYTDNNFEFTGPSGNEPVIEADSVKKYFNYARGVGSSDALFTNYAAVGDNLNVDVSNENFAAIFFVKTPTVGSQNQLMSFSSSNQNNSFQFFMQNNGTLRARYRVGGSNTNITTTATLSSDSYYIIVVGTKSSSGDVFIRINGTDDGVSGSIGDISITSASGSSQISLMSRETGGAYSTKWGGNMYEFYWLKSSTTDNSFLSEIEKIEGGLAQKYDTLGDLPTDHTYKTEVPRGSPIKHAPDRFG